MEPETLRHGAVSCRRLAQDGAAVARQVKAYAVPDEGVPPEALSQVHDAMNQLQRSAIAVERQALFIHQSLLLGLAADAPSKFGAHIKVPGLLSPWAKHKDKGGPFDFIGDAASAMWHVLKGGAGEAFGMVKGTADTVVTLAAVTLMEVSPAAAKLIPGATKKAKQFEAGVAYAMKHPKDTLEAIGKDAIAYKLWSEGHYAEAIGHNVVLFGTLFISFSKLGKGMDAVNTASKAERTAAAVAGAERATVGALQRDAYALRRTAEATAGSASRDLERATVRHNVAEGRHATAQQILERRQAEHAANVAEANKGARPGAGDVVKVGAAGSAQMEDDQKAKKP